VIGALAALQQRQRTGKGCVIDTSLFESACALVDGAINGYWHTGRVPVRTGTASNLLTPYQTFATADRPICIAAGNDRIFARLARAMGEPGWAGDERFRDGPARARNRAALVALMEPILAALPRAHWMTVLEAAGVPCSPVNDIGELATSDQLAAMDMARELPGSGLKVVGLPISFDRVRPHPHADSPTLGQHDDPAQG